MEADTSASSCIRNTLCVTHFVCYPRDEKFSLRTVRKFSNLERRCTFNESPLTEFRWKKGKQSTQSEMISAQVSLCLTDCETVLSIVSSLKIEWKNFAPVLFSLNRQ